MTAFQQFIKKQYGLSFTNNDILLEALTHSSYSNENKYRQGIYNERIEFLGDAVLELFISQWLYTAYPTMPEGKMTRLRAQIVCEESLCKLAIECRLNQAILLGKGEEKSGGRERPALLCDAFEAFVGAIYLDKGFNEVSRFLELVITSKIQDGKFLLNQDYKTELQEELQKQGAVNIQYILENESGPAHDKVFHVAVHFEDKEIGRGSGKTKKAAEQVAAQKALEQMKDRGV